MKRIIPKSQIYSGSTTIRNHYINSVRNADTANIILEASRAWDGLDKFRKNAHRCRDYPYGKQWTDRIKDPATGKWITEETYIKAQGKIP